MGRRRRHADPNEPLPPGLYKYGRRYRARIHCKAPWVYFEGGYVAAVSAYAAWKRESGKAETVGWLLDICSSIVWPGKVRAKQLTSRTAEDYARDALVLKKGLGHIPIAALRPPHIATYRDARAQAAPSHVRNEMACLSAALAYGVERGLAMVNVCKEVRRPSKPRRMRLISDAEYLNVYAVAADSVRVAMTLAVRTLASPIDLLQLGPRNVVRLPDGRRILRFGRDKTRRTTSKMIEVEIVGELAAVIDAYFAKAIAYPTFIHTREGKPYTREGIGAMFRRYCGKDKANVPDFGLRDLRAKGATDMYRAKVDIRQIQHLLGHSSVRTTEIYLKSLVPEIVRPNEVPIIAEVRDGSASQR